MRAKYVGTQEYLNHKEYFHLKKYRKRKSFFHYKQYEIDPAIFTPINLDCKHCHLVHTMSCCEQGKPYSMTSAARKRLEKHAYSIILTHLDDQRMKEAAQSGYEELDVETSISSIKQCKGDCFFYRKDQNEAFCSIHRYAEDKKLDPLQYKPFSCSLFPLDIIEENGKVLITALTEETAGFSRWGTSYRDYVCIDPSLREDKDLEENLFQINQYKPAWEWNTKLLINSFGDELIEAIRNIKE